MTSIVSNSTGQFAVSQYIVSPVGGKGNYFTIASALAAANAAGGGTVYIYPGTYTENLTFTAGLNVIGSITGTPNQEIMVVGNQTYSATGVVSLQNIAFSSSSGNTWTYNYATSASQSSLEFLNCSITATAGNAVTMNNSLGFANLLLTSCTLLASGSAVSASGNAVVDANSSTLSTSTNGTNTINLAGGSSLSCGSSTFNNSGIGTGACVSLNGATSSVQSANCIYNASSSANCAAFLFTISGAAVGTIMDRFFVTGTYWARATGAFGLLAYAAEVISGGTSLIDPQITQNILPEVPGGIPTVNGQMLIGSTGAAPVLATLTAGLGVAITNGAGSITIAAAGGSGLTWSSISANQALSSDHGYVVASGALSLSLPAASNVGDVIVVTLDAGTSWTIIQAAGQQIRAGFKLSTLGVGGTLASTDSGDSVSLVCTVVNTKWLVYGSIGNLNIV
jgi:hypothetical protein